MLFSGDQEKQTYTCLVQAQLERGTVVPTLLNPQMEIWTTLYLSQPDNIPDRGFCYTPLHAASEDTRPCHLLASHRTMNEASSPTPMGSGMALLNSWSIFLEGQKSDLHP